MSGIRERSGLLIEVDLSLSVSFSRRSLGMEEVTQGECVE